MNLQELHELGRSIAEVSRRAMIPPGVSFDLSSADAAIMARLIECPDAVTITELTKRSGFAQSRVSGVVARLRSLGWVTTETSATDRRQTMVRLTPEVRRGIASVFIQPPDAALAELLETLTPRERRQVIEALELLVRRRQQEEPAG